MTSTDCVVFVLALILMMLGLLGTVLPGLPGAPIIFVAALLHRIVRGESGPAWSVVAVLGVMALVSIGLDFAATGLGARRMGSTWRGAVGAVAGAMAGMLWLPFGLIIGPLVGAVILEMVGGREWRDAGKAGFGAVVGMFVGAVARIACAVAMIGLFVVHMLLRWIITAPSTP